MEKDPLDQQTSPKLSVHYASTSRRHSPVLTPTTPRYSPYKTPRAPPRSFHVVQNASQSHSRRSSSSSSSFSSSPCSSPIMCSTSFSAAVTLSGPLGEKADFGGTSSFAEETGGDYGPIIQSCSNKFVSELSTSPCRRQVNLEAPIPDALGDFLAVRTLSASLTECGNQPFSSPLATCEIYDPPYPPPFSISEGITNLPDESSEYSESYEDSGSESPVFDINSESGSCDCESDNDPEQEPAPEMFLLSPRNSNEVQCNNPQCPPSPTIIALSDLLNRARLVPPSPPPAPPPVIIIACGFAYLPKELHWLIFMNLPVADLCRCARVCRSWQQWIDQILILPDMWFHYQYIIALKKELVWCKSNGNYFVVQTALTEKMRAILLEWMFEVSENLHLGEQSAFTAMCLLDQFLARTTEQVPPSKLQLFGATSLLTASKAVSTFEPTLGLASKVTFMSAGTFTHPELLQAEKKVLSTLNYRLLAPSPSMFLEMFLELPQLQPVVSTTNFTKLTKFYLEVSTLNFSLQLLKPSILSAAVIILSAHTLGKSIWFKLNEYIPLFTRKELKEIAFCMTRLHEHILFIQAQTTFTSTLHKFEPISSLTPILPPFD